MEQNTYNWSVSYRQARAFRNNPSRPEAQLWAHLRLLRSDGFHFRRQHKVSQYYLDFACLTYRLAVEVDGPKHDDPIQAEHDRVRDIIVKRAGFRTLRFDAGCVMNDTAEVIRCILFHLEDLKADLEAQKVIQESAKSSQRTLGGQGAQRPGGRVT